VSYILVLYFMGTHVAYDLPSREECGRQAAMLAQVLQRKATGKLYSSYSYSHQCWGQSPILVELAASMGQEIEPNIKCRAPEIASVVQKGQTFVQACRVPTPDAKAPQ
jgi:hypothetical protein